MSFVKGSTGHILKWWNCEWSKRNLRWDILFTLDLSENHRKLIEFCCPWIFSPSFFSSSKLSTMRWCIAARRYFVSRCLALFLSLRYYCGLARQSGFCYQFCHNNRPHMLFMLTFQRNLVLSELLLLLLLVPFNIGLCGIYNNVYEWRCISTIFCYSIRWKLPCMYICWMLVLIIICFSFARNVESEYFVCTHMHGYVVCRTFLGAVIWIPH